MPTNVSLSPDPQKNLSSRHLALIGLTSICEKRITFDAAMAGLTLPATLSERDRKFLHNMVYTTLRHSGQITAIQKKMIAKPLAKNKRWVSNLISLSIAQLIYLKTPIHAVVATALAVLDDKHQPHFKPLVNGVLRTLARNPQAVATLIANPKLNIPNWMQQGWQQTIGKEATAILPTLLEQKAPIDIAWHGQYFAEKKDFIEQLKPYGGCQYHGFDSIRLPDIANITHLPGFDSGRWWVQDLAASACLALIKPDMLTNRDVIDLCAAPGGKTAWLASRGARVTAVDIAKKRLERLEENLQRLKLDVKIECADASQWSPPKAADLVVLDAPCSATGTLRRHPEIALIRRQDDVIKLAKTQRKLIDNALTMVKKGGHILFMTCALQPEEGEAHLTYITAKYAEQFRIIAPDKQLYKQWPNMIFADGYLRPHANLNGANGGMDGFFAVLLQRIKKPPNI